MIGSFDLPRLDSRDLRLVVLEHSNVSMTMNPARLHWIRSFVPKIQISIPIIVIIIMLYWFDFETPDICVFDSLFYFQISQKDITSTLRRLRLANITLENCFL